MPGAGVNVAYSILDLLPKLNLGGLYVVFDGLYYPGPGL